MPLDKFCGSLDSKSESRMRGLIIFLIALSLSGPKLYGQSIEFSSLPRNLEIVTRNESNLGLVRIAGIENQGGFSDLVIRFEKDGELIEERQISLSYSNGSASFDTNFEIETGLNDHSFRISISDGNANTEIIKITGVCAGDVFLVNGQSNAESGAREGSANGNRHPYIRTISPSGEWLQAEGDTIRQKDSVGQWPLRMARGLLERFQVPVALVNSAFGGKPITFFTPNPLDPLDPSTNYGMALRRLQGGGFQNDIKAIFWYQGEFDKQSNISPEDYISLFDVLYEAWQRDLSGFERIYVFQIRQGCGTQSASGVQEAQRRMGHLHDDIVLITTTGLDGHDGCHFSYNSGYEVLGDHSSFLLGQDLYGEGGTSFFSPTVQTLYFSNNERNEITITTQNQEDRMVFDSGSEVYFEFSDPSVFSTGGSASGNSITLQLNKTAETDLLVSYLGHAGPGSWITNEKGVGFATFAGLEISVDVSTENVELPLEEISIDLYPQPSQGQLFLNVDSKETRIVDIHIINLNGQRVLTLFEDLLIEDGKTFPLDLSSLTPGSYILELMSESDRVLKLFLTL